MPARSEPVATARTTRERVHLDGGAHDERLQHVALDLLHEQHDAEHDERDHRPVVDEGDEDREGAGHDRADDRDERAEEDEDRDRDRRAAHRGGTRRGRCRSRRSIATRICTFTKFCSVTQPASPAPSTAARARRGKRPTIQRQMPRPSMRMNRVANSVSSTPARTCPSVEPTDSAPLSEDAAVLLHGGRRPASTKSFSCASVMCERAARAARRGSRPTPRATAPRGRRSRARSHVIAERRAGRRRRRARASIATATASHFGQRWRCRNCENGTSSAAEEHGDEQRDDDEPQLDDEEDDDREHAADERGGATTTPRRGASRTGTESEASRRGGGVSPPAPRRLPIDLPRACPATPSSLQSRRAACAGSACERRDCRRSRYRVGAPWSTPSAPRSPAASPSPRRASAAPRPARRGTRQVTGGASTGSGCCRSTRSTCSSAATTCRCSPRLGDYDKALLDRLTFGRRGRYRRVLGARGRVHPASSSGRCSSSACEDYRRRTAADWGGWLVENRTLADWLRAELAANGPMPASDIEHDAERAPRAVVGLVRRQAQRSSGCSASARSSASSARRFERIYALPEQVLPRRAARRRAGRGRRRARAHRARGRRARHRAPKPTSPTTAA